MAIKPQTDSKPLGQLGNNPDVRSKSMKRYPSQKLSLQTPIANAQQGYGPEPRPRMEAKAVAAQPTQGERTVGWMNDQFIPPKYPK